MNKGRKSVGHESVGPFDFLPCHAQNKEDGVEIGDIHRGISGTLDHRLGVEGDAQACDGQHVQIICAVTHGNSL